MLRDPDAFLQHLQQVPFVNGGLFDCLDTFEATGDGGERIDCFTDNPNQRRSLHVPAKLFFHAKDGIFPLFNRYKFTVEENTPVEQEVALDPELLGQVFENLLGAYNPETQSTARKATGSYYTPRQIVDYMVDEALIAYFLQKVEPYDNDKAYLEDRLRDDLLAYDQQGKIDNPDDHLIDENEIESIIAAIDELKIIDPAVGSGAFPMGILNKLVLILKKLDPQNEHWKQQQLQQITRIDDPEVRDSAAKEIEEAFSKKNRYSDYGRKLYLIKNSIYGVDIQPIAITIAKLRFFISLIIDQVPNDNPDDNYGIQPLPNLEVKFVAANTLIGLNRSETQMLLGTDEVEDIRSSISLIREKYFMENNRQKKLKLIGNEEVLRKELVQALTSVARRWMLRETSGPLEIAEKIAAWDPYNQNAIAEFFDPDWMFGIKDGFDIAIGNPPYIRQEKLSDLKPELKEYFGTFYSGKADISVYFFKRAAELLRIGGILTYICTNKFMRSGYGKNLRQFLTTDMSLQILLDFGKVSVFEAAVNTCIALVENRIVSAEHIVSVSTLKQSSGEFKVRELFQEQAFPMLISQFVPDGWALTSSETLALIEKIQNTGISLDQCVNSGFYRGVVTGCNDAFVINEVIRAQLITEDAESVELIKPLFRGRDIKKWKTDSTGLYLIFTRQGIDIDQYPAVKRHLNQYKDDLEGRVLGNYEWYEIQANTAYYREFNKPKIVYTDTAKFFSACYDTAQTFGLNTMYLIPTQDYSLLAILNSQLFDWYARYKFQTLNDPWAGGGLRFFSQYMKNVPIANRTTAQKADFSRLVEQILADPESDEVSELEKEIDALVYRLYGLTRSEIALIEQTYRDAGMDV